MTFRSALLPALFVVAAVGAATLLGAGCGNESGSGRSRARVPAHTKVAVISEGETVELADFAAPTGLTVFEYTADW